MYRRILVPTDGSEETGEAVEHAIDIAKQYGAEVHALYVVDRHGLPTTDVDMIEEFVEQAETEGAAAVKSVADAAEAAGVEAVTAVVGGHPSDEIIDYATDNDVDLIVMGTHGRSGLRHFMLGSVAEKVVRHANDPVMLVRMAA